MSDDPTAAGQRQTPASVAGVFQEVEDQLAAEARATYDAAAGLAKIVGGEQEAATPAGPGASAGSDLTGSAAAGHSAAARHGGTVKTSPRRLAAVTSPGDERAVGPVHRSIIAVDLEGATGHSDPVRGELRRVMYDLLGRSLEAAGITGDRLEPLSDRGDRVLVLVRPHDDVPKMVLLDRLMPLLTALLTEYNAHAPMPELRIRLRAVVHAGEVHMDGRGFYGEAIDVATRLLDSQAVKRAQKEAKAPLVLVVSDEIYSGIVSHGHLDASSYLPLVRVRAAGRSRRGWVHTPVPAARPDLPASVRSSRLSAAADPLAPDSRKSLAHEGSAMPLQVELRVHDDVALSEIELYTEVLTAVAASDGPLSREELDEALGIGRKDAQDGSGQRSRPDANATAKPRNRRSTENTPLAR
jgi:hypothetical protein